MDQQTTTKSRMKPATRTALVLTGVTLIIIVGYFVWKKITSSTSSNGTVVQSTQVTTPSSSTSDNNSNTTAKTPIADSKTITENWKSYLNTDYSFGLTFGDIWKGYEVKKLVPADDSALAYYYFNMPTSDPNYGKSSPSTSAGFATIFAVSVMTHSQWSSLQAAGGPINDTVISSNTNSNEVFVYQHGQAYPPSLSVNATDIPNVIASFKNY